ncbi:hypothetical protein SAMN04487782_3194 [Stenotrophomonas maltophilia]|nr:hypothetical protein SAMN04487782_3194 [Stenotrophomonas maltophilia]
MVLGFGAQRAGARSAAIGGAPSWLGWGAYSGFLGVGRVGGLRRGRREPILGGLAAASMPRTPRLTPPTRRLTGSCGCQPRKTEQNQKQKPVASLLTARFPKFPGCRPAAGTTAEHPRMACVQYDRGSPSKAGWVRWRGCPRHGCRGQAPRDGFTASPATGPTPPSHRHPAFALAVAVAVAVVLASAGAGRSPAQAHPPLPVQYRARFPTTVPRT